MKINFWILFYFIISNKVFTQIVINEGSNKNYSQLVDENNDKPAGNSNIVERQD